MKCSNCGSEILDSAKKCPYCGKIVIPNLSKAVNSIDNVFSETKNVKIDKLNTNLENSNKTDTNISTNTVSEKSPSKDDYILPSDMVKVEKHKEDEFVDPNYVKITNDISFTEAKKAQIENAKKTISLLDASESENGVMLPILDLDLNEIAKPYNFDNGINFSNTNDELPTVIKVPEQEILKEKPSLEPKKSLKDKENEYNQSIAEKVFKAEHKGEYLSENIVIERVEAKPKEEPEEKIKFTADIPSFTNSAVVFKKRYSEEDAQRIKQLRESNKPLKTRLFGIVALYSAIAISIFTFLFALITIIINSNTEASKIDNVLQDIIAFGNVFVIILICIFALSLVSGIVQMFITPNKKTIFNYGIIVGLGGICGAYFYLTGFIDSAFKIIISMFN